jgi:uncharacterized membrane protein
LQLKKGEEMSFLVAMQMNGGMMGGGMMGGGMMLIWSVVGILLIVLLVVAIVKLLK